MNFLKYIPSLSIAFFGGLIANYLHFPIPWLMGSLLLVAISNLSGVPIYSASFSRKAGLLIIGISLGLYFTPQMVNLLFTHFYLPLAGAVFNILLGILGSIILYHVAKVEFKTAWFASVVGGAGEMSNFAHIHNARVDKVVMVHTLRAFMVATFVPFFYKFMGFHGDDMSSAPINSQVSYAGLTLLIILSVCMALVFEKLKWTSPWCFAPLLLTGSITAMNFHLSAIPYELSCFGQVLIGWTLGTKFKPDFFKTAPRLVAATCLMVLLYLSLTALLCWILSKTLDFNIAILGLGFAPGGVAEMTITAKILQLGVPIVTMLQVTRMIVVLGTAGFLHEKLKVYFSR